MPSVVFRKPLMLVEVLVEPQLLKWVYRGWSLFIKGHCNFPQEDCGKEQPFQKFSQQDRGLDREREVCYMVFKREKVLVISGHIKLC